LKTSTALAALSLLLFVAEVSVFVGVGLGYYTIVQSVMSTMGTGGGTPIQYTGTVDQATGAFNGSVALSLGNPGMLDIVVQVSVKLKSEEGATLFQTSGQERVAPGSSRTMELPLSLSGTVVQRVHTVVLGLRFITLFDMISFSVEVPMPAQMGSGAPGA
jgi:hypothetical protein